MAVTQQQAQQLTKLYERRSNLQRLAREVDHNFWVRVRDEITRPVGTPSENVRMASPREPVIEALGGVEGFVSWIRPLSDARFRELLTQVEEAIIAAGGEV